MRLRNRATSSAAAATAGDSTNRSRTRSSGPRPGAVSRVIRTGLDRGDSPEELRRNKRYLDMVEEIWQMLREYLV